MRLKPRAGTVAKAAKRMYRSRLVPERVRELRRQRAASRDLLATITVPPATFNEKVRYRMATDRRRILTVFADKVSVRDYVREKVGEHILARVYAVTEEPQELLDSGLPREFVVKASHASGGIVVVADHVPPLTRLPRPPVGWSRLAVAPANLEWDSLVDLCRDWLGRRYNPYEEWAYAKVTPRILVEELLPGDGGVPFDFRFFVFGGNVRVIQVEQDRFGDHRRNLYSPEWELLDVQYGYPRGRLDPRPAKLERMIAVAERLADGIDFVRVDLYDSGGRVVFGEMTIYPVSGQASFHPSEFDAYLGSMWPDPPRRWGALRRAGRARDGRGGPS
jgi:hypothetical protein